MQRSGVFSFLLCVACMYCIYNGWHVAANFIFALSLISLLVSLLVSLAEIWISTNALELLLSDVEELTDENFLQKILRFKTEEGDDEKKEEEKSVKSEDHKSESKKEEKETKEAKNEKDDKDEKEEKEEK